ncbi:MAG: hypothetical protein IJR33_10055 [Clostridia bacterium]|nr:hypothetical protein [Clostridia bacterium]
MFGYVTVCKESLNEADFETFRAYYCGLCREIGRRTTQAARLGLSYDITFLAIMLSSLADDGGIVMRSCAAKGFKKRGFVEGDRAVGYAADMGVLLTYLKLSDDWNDDRSIKALSEMLVFKRAVNKAKKRYPHIYEEIKRHLEDLSTLEAAKSGSIDETADCFAKILETLFAPDFITDEAERRALAWLGYNIGRWIYIIDAYNDIEKDRKKGSYNLFLCRESVDKNAVDKSLTFTLENAASAYNLLKIKRNGAILDNILYDALKMKQKAILGEANESL